MIPVKQWSAREIRALREARRMSLREFSAHLGVSSRMISKWEASDAAIRPRPFNQAALDTCLARAAEHERELFRALLRGSSDPHPSPVTVDGAAGGDEQ